MSDLTGKVAYITGVARGQGRSHAIALAKRGVRIVGVDICAPVATAPYDMADENDLVRRCRVQGLGFDHPDPAEWATPYDWSQVQRAPDYHPELDLYVVAPDGEFMSSCIVWYDAHNRLGFFEPVSTHMGHRRRGFGREVVLEGIRRVAALGATRARVGSGQPFYTAIGFERKWVSHPWSKSI